MSMISKLAKSRLRYNRSQTILTGIAIILTACLLMTVSSMGIGIFRTQKAETLRSNQNHHARFVNVTPDQLETLKLHLDVESLTAVEVYASITYDKMNATLRQQQVLIPGIRGISLVAGRQPEAANEITGPPAFFERLGYAEPALGDVVEIPYRVMGKGEIIYRDFTISGLLEQVDLSQYSVADTRIVYAALISQALADEDLENEERSYEVTLRVDGEEQLSSSQIKAVLYDIAADIGVDEDDVQINDNYLMWVTDPGVESMTAVIGISLVIVLFAALVIYGIYYVSIITNVQELGKLKALGATKRQMKGLILREGMLVTIVGLPIGLLLGYLIALGCMKLMHSFLWQDAAAYGVSILSIPVILLVIAVVLITAVVSMLRPMSLVAKISPMEAVRYQEKTASNRARRKGYDFLNVSRLSIANMGRNRRRTAITIVTMGLAGIMFLSLGTLMSSMDELDYVRRRMPKGDFYIDLRYETDDKTYLENNLNLLQQTDVVGSEAMEQLRSLPGAAKVEESHKVLGYIHLPGFEEEQRYTISSFTREDVANLDLKQGKVDYDAMTADHGILLTYDSMMQYHGLHLGDTIPITLFDGEREVTFEGTLVASTHIWDGDLAIPADLLNEYIPETNSVNGMYVWADGGATGDTYQEVKTELQQFISTSNYLQLMSLDEELGLARSSMQAIRMAMYLLVAVLGVVSFLTLINTLVTSVITRRREIGTLQAIGLSNSQLGKMLWQEALIFTGGTMVCALTIGNILGYVGYLWAREKGFMGIVNYHYPLAETLILVLVLMIGQFIITRILSRHVHHESLVKRIQL